MLLRGAWPSARLHTAVDSVLLSTRQEAPRATRWRTACSAGSAALSATSSQQAWDLLPRALLKALGMGWFTVAQVQGAGRGLVAVQDIQQGTDVLRERPLAAVPAAHHAARVCLRCLAMLMPPGGESRQQMCASCQEACNSDMPYQAHAHADWTPLTQTCEAHGHRFPLIAARLACARLTAAAGHAGTPQPLRAAAAGAPTAAELQGDAATDLHFLCYARVPLPHPREWVVEWGHMRTALLQAARWLLNGQPGGHRVMETAAATSADPAEHLLHAAGLDVDWYVDALARLHVNVFRVDTVLLPLGAVGDEVGGGTGSAVYTVASLVNHSCEPNLDVLFPRNDSLLVLRAARDIAAGEQLCISYVDASRPLRVRQDALHFAYGFACGCALCREELSQCQ